MDRRKLLFVILYFYLYHPCYGELCSANANMHWKRSKSKCVKCKGCRFGLARNLTEEYVGRTGEHGAERCLPCRPPPDGYFVAENMFKLCVVNCTHNNRMTVSSCGRTSDATCGSCLPGFESVNNNSQSPCYPNKITTDSVTFNETTSTPVESPPNKTETTPSATDHNGGFASQLPMYIGLSIAAVALVSLLAVFIMKQKRKPKKQRFNGQGLEENVQLTRYRSGLPQ